MEKIQTYFELCILINKDVLFNFNNLIDMLQLHDFTLFTSLLKLKLIERLPLLFPIRHGLGHECIERSAVVMLDQVA